MYLILPLFLSFRAANFLANLRGLLVPGSKAIRGRDGFTRDFGHGRYENLSGAISWLTFLRAEQLTPGEDRAIAHGAKMERGSLRNTEPAICSQRKPSSFRCSTQPAGSRGVRRINVGAG